jgi:hypothetical protein
MGLLWFFKLAWLILQILGLNRFHSWKEVITVISCLHWSGLWQCIANSAYFALRILIVVLEVGKIQGVSDKYATLICMGILCTHQFLRLICQVLNFCPAHLQQQQLQVRWSVFIIQCFILISSIQPTMHFMRSKYLHKASESRLLQNWNVWSLPIILFSTHVSPSSPVPNVLRLDRSSCN